MRLDKLLANQGFGSRKEVKQLVKKASVKVNGETVRAADHQIDAAGDEVTVNGQRVTAGPVYYMMNKPTGVITSTEDPSDPVVMALLEKKDLVKGLFPVGRLDKDTTGLLLITNDGPLSHQLLSPKHHAEKIYIAELDGVITEEMKRKFKEGFVLRDGHLTAPALLSAGRNEHEAVVTLTEGKYHQVKRMFAACGRHVDALKRTGFGGIKLDRDLDPGAYRPLTEQEIAVLRKGVSS